MLPSNRAIFGLCAVTAIALLGYGYYLQFYEHLDPCPMCIFQRICYFFLAIVAAAAAIHHARGIGHRVYSTLCLLVAGLGAGIAGRQTWLQHLPPDKVPECGPGLDFMLEMYPLGETIMKTLRGSGDCAVVDWQFLTLSIAEWSLVCFCGFVIVSLVLLCRKTKVNTPGN
ncbi:MAG: disulfide bond formation protein B [Pseudomonadota bacterium]